VRQQIWSQAGAFWLRVTAMARHMDDGNIALRVVDGHDASSGGSDPDADNLGATMGDVIGGDGSGANVLGTPVASGDGADVCDFFGAEVASGRFSTGTINNIILLDPIGMEARA
jgi:hypothetical protein